MTAWYGHVVESRADAVEVDRKPLLLFDLQIWVLPNPLLVLVDPHIVDKVPLRRPRLRLKLKAVNQAVYAELYAGYA